MGVPVAGLALVYVPGALLEQDSEQTEQADLHDVQTGHLKDRTSGVRNPAVLPGTSVSQPGPRGPQMLHF